MPQWSDSSAELSVCSFTRKGESGDSLQRLFSTFPNGRPGLGLIVLRLAIFAFLIHGFCLHVPGQGSSGALGVVAAGTAAFILMGLWTPIAGATAVGIELCMAFSRPEEL